MLSQCLPNQILNLLLILVSLIYNNLSHFYVNKFILDCAKLFRIDRQAYDDKVRRSVEEMLGIDERDIENE